MNNKLVYAEVNTILKYMNVKYSDKIPIRLKEFFEENALNVVVNFDPRIPIENQNLQLETLAILAMLNLNYWCEDEEHKKELIYKYNERDKEKKEKLEQKYNTDDILKKRIKHKKNLNINKNTSLSCVNEHWYNRIYAFFSKVFKKIIKK